MMANPIMYGLLLCLAALVFWVVFCVCSPSTYMAAVQDARQCAVQVLVLGDLGRSPRMSYHASSMAKHGGTVYLIGYLESALHPDVANNPSIKIVRLPAPPQKPSFIPFLFFAPAKVLLQVVQLLWALGYKTPAAKWLLVQNPPSIPTLAMAALVSHLRNTRLIIDWHNYGWTILAGTRGPRHPFVRLSFLHERFFGRLGSLNLTVTEAMARQLRSSPYNLPSPTLPVHDRPAHLFQPMSSPSARASGLARVLSITSHTDLVSPILAGQTRLVVSSTSWTPDEDFSLFLVALVAYAAAAAAAANPPLLVLITGRGPQRADYLALVESLVAQNLLRDVTVASAFLPFPDYASLLACADLGVCLHTSSSGVDLPMKIVDMLGAGLPVAAYSGYESFGELIREGVNGVGFTTAAQLAGILGDLLGEGSGEKLARLREGAVREGNRRWDEEWDDTVGRALGLVVENG